MSFHFFGLIYRFVKAINNSRLVFQTKTAHKKSKYQCVTTNIENR